MIRTLLPLLVLSGCEPYEPPLRPKDDPRLRPVPNVITGSVEVSGPEEPAQTMLLVFDDAAPGPPEGTSGPVDFATIGVDEFNGSAELGFSASWSVVEVPDGAYQIEAIVDVDGDFSPGAFTLGGATCGDWQGAYRSEPGASEKGAVGVSGGELLEGVPIQVTERLDTERPAFRVPNDDGYRTISLQAAGANPTAPLTYRLVSTGVHVQFTEEAESALELADACTPDPADPRFCEADTGCETAFSILYRDKDGDGVMDPHPDYPPDFGLKDIYPRVLLEYLGTVEFDGDGKVVRDENGFPQVTPPDLPDGVYWATENFTYGLEAAFGIPVLPLETPTKAPEISVMFPPLVAKFYDEWDPACGGEPPEDPSEGCSILYDLSDPDQRAQVPTGAWGINLVSWTGQTWGIPNEISEWGVPVTQPDYDISTQGGFLLTTP